jgi:isopentenyl diphosphate isomerase/L-lactate dehydrogenase-like FMN-dependent dehydrogenase
MKIERAVNVDDVRRMARRRLPKPVFDMIDGGAGDELTLRRNRDAFADLVFRPKVLADIHSRDLTTRFFGESVSMPLALAPTGAGRAVDRYAELSVAKAAKAAGVLYMQSTVAGYPMEKIAEAGGRPIWFQLYLPNSRDKTLELLARAEDSGYGVLAVTVDNAVTGNRYRDARNRVVIPAKVTPRLIFEGMTRPAWSVEFVRGNLTFRNRFARSGRLTAGETQRQILAASMFPVKWADLDLIRSRWTGPLLVKGVMRSDEVDRMVGMGIDGFVVSNHGGRQLDGVPASIEALPDIVAAAAGRAQVFIDGDIRRGSDVVKAIALGAAGAFVGRPYLFGLAAGGQKGVERVLEMFRDEIDRTLALLGCARISELDSSFVSWRRNGDREAAY